MRELRIIYRMKSKRCNPEIVLIKDLCIGDYFYMEEPETEELVVNNEGEFIFRVTSEPYDTGNGIWGVMVEQ